MEPRKLFPRGYALGEAFFDREEERKRLKSNYLKNQHLVVLAPRRYGKTSLIKQVMLETGLPGKRIDLLPATNTFFVQRAIKACVTELINEIAPKTKKAKDRLIEFIKSLHPKLTLNFFGQSLEISSRQAPDASIMDLLTSLNTIAEKLNKRVVVCFDEFQQVGLLKDHSSIEASIRHAAEASTHVSYVFSGSSRHLLNQMFSTKSRPLYHLCDLMKLDRIDHDVYFVILLEKAKDKWGKNIDERAIKQILALTKCHAYYVNAICHALWEKSKSPTVAIVQKTWIDFIAEQTPWITDDLSRLSPNQRNILAGLAYSEITEPLSQNFIQLVKLTASSISTSLEILMRDDFVYKDHTGHYRVLDPAIETYLHEIKYFDFLDE